MKVPQSNENHQALNTDVPRLESKGSYLMMPPTMLAPHEELLYPTQTSPELRRMDMFNRARREEMNAMIHGMNSRDAIRTAGSRRSKDESFTFSRLLNGLRNGIGNALVSAGNRIQSPA